MSYIVRELYCSTHALCQEYPRALIASCGVDACNQDFAPMMGQWCTKSIANAVRTRQKPSLTGVHWQSAFRFDRQCHCGKSNLRLVI